LLEILEEYGIREFTERENSQSVDSQSLVFSKASDLQPIPKEIVDRARTISSNLNSKRITAETAAIDIAPPHNIDNRKKGNNKKQKKNPEKIIAHENKSNLETREKHFRIAKYQ
jgi:hypothetical protein